MVATPVNLTGQAVQTAGDQLLKALNRKHPLYEANCQRWKTLRALVAGGKAVTDQVKKQVLANPDNRPEQVIKERVKVATYSNRIAPILTRFNAQLFERDATYKGSKDAFWQDSFFKDGGRLPVDDDNRASFFTFLRESMFEALTTGKAIAQIDTAISSDPLSRANQRSLGEDEPYVVLRYQDSLWDWDNDADGFRYCKLHDFQVVRPDWFSDPVGQHRFTIYEKLDDGRTVASVYLVRKIPKPGEKPDNSEFKLDGLKVGKDVAIAPLEVNGKPFVQIEVFNLNGKYKFPIVTLTLPGTLCLADQLFDCQVAYFNTLAGIQWKLQALNFAMPVLTGGDVDDDDPLQNAKFGDGFYLRLPRDYALSSLEIGGTAIASAAAQLDRIKGDIREILYQLALSAADGAAIKAQSAASKREDTRVERTMLEVYGQQVREYAKQILDVASLAHQEEVDWEVDGFSDFLGGGMFEDLTEFQMLQTVPVPSVELKREVATQVAKQFFKTYDTDEDVANKILDEIKNASPEDFEPPQPEQPGNAPGNEGQAQEGAQNEVSGVPQTGQVQKGSGRVGDQRGKGKNDGNL